jgi:integrase
MYDFPKKVHYPVGCYRDGGENADGAEPASGRAEQHLSESTDTKTECRNAYPRIPDPRRGREADRRRQAGASARAKNGKPAVHPIRGDELRMLRKLQRNTTSAFVFETERGGPFTADAVNRLVKTIGKRAKLSFGVHAHMLRHACGYALANAGHDTRLIQDWLGHRAIQHTARYTELSPTRFKDVWR